MNTKQYMDILEAKIFEAKGQLSQEAQNYIDNEFDSDLFFGPMAYQSIIENRYYMNDSDEQDWNLCENILHLIDLLMELDDDFIEDVMIEIDED